MQLNILTLFMNSVIITLILSQFTIFHKTKTQPLFFGGFTIGLILASFTGNLNLFISAVSFIIYIFSSVIWWITHFWIGIALIEIFIMGISLTKKEFFDMIYFYITAHIHFFKGMFDLLTIFINLFISAIQTITHSTITGATISAFLG